MSPAQQNPITITFLGAPMAEANKYASGLAASLRDLEQGLTVEQRKERPDTQDFGATLVILLGTASATAVAKGIAAWLARHSGAKIQINADGSVIADNLDSRDAAKIAEALSKRS